MHKLLSLSFLLFLSLSFPALAQLDQVERLNREAYLTLTDAKDLDEKDDQVNALTSYKKARDLYQELRTLDPEFNAESVTWRLKELDTRIAALEKIIPSETVNEASATENSVEDYQRLYLQAREKIAREANRLLDLEKRHVETLTRLRELINRSEENQKELAALRRENATLRGDTGRELAALRKEVNDLARFNDLLQDRADKLETTNKQLSGERNDVHEEATAAKAALAQAETDLAEAQNRVRAAESSASLSEQRITLERNQLRDDLRTAEEKAAQSLAALESKEKEAEAAQTELANTKALLDNQKATTLAAAEEFKAKETAWKTQLEDAENKIKDLSVLAGNEKELQAENKVLAQEKQDLEENNRMLKEQLDTLTRDQKDLLSSVETLTQEKEETESTIQTLRVQEGNLKENNRMLKEQLAALTNDQKDLLKVIEDRDQLKAEVEKLQAARKADQSTWDETESARASAEKERNELRKDLEKIKKRNLLIEEKMAEAEKEQWQSRDQIKSLTKQVREAEDAKTEAIKSRQKNITTLAETQEALETAQLNAQQASQAREQLQQAATQQLKSIAEKLNSISDLESKISKQAETIQELQARLAPKAEEE